MARRALAAALAGGCIGRLADAGDWPELVREARREGLEGLVYAVCLREGLAAPGAVVAELARGHRELAARNLATMAQLDELLGELAAAGVDAAVLPGASLLHQYPDPGCRSMEDVDLLVLPGREEATARCLEAAGLCQPEGHAGVFRRDDLVVDVHTDLVNGARQPSRALASWMDPAEVWQRRRRLAAGEGGFWVLGPEDEVLYTAVHALRHSYRRLAWLCDLRLLLGAIDDWGRLGQRARACSADRALAYGLRFLEEEAAAPLAAPAAAYWRVLPCGPVEERLVRALFRRRREAELGELLWSWSCRGWVARARFLADFLFPRPRVLRQVYPRVPGGLLPLAYAMRAAAIVHRGGSALMSLAKG